MQEVKKILITGANGAIGKNLVKIILEQSDFRIHTLVNCKDKMLNALGEIRHSDSERVEIIENKEFVGENLSGQYDVLIHLAFSRGNRSAKDIAQSLDYTSFLFEKAKKMGIKKIIYISSQGVYGKTSELRKETTLVEPSTPYTMAKYAGEKLLESYFADDNETEYAILRLDNVIQSQNLVRSLCRSAINNQHINLKGGKQIFSYIDLYDAAMAIFEFCKLEHWKFKIYNVGPNKMRVSLLEIAETVKNVAKSYNNSVCIELEEDSTELWAGMDTDLFSEETGWKPIYDLRKMIDRIYNEEI